MSHQEPLWLNSCVQPPQFLNVVKNKQTKPNTHLSDALIKSKALALIFIYQRTCHWANAEF